MSEPQDAPPIDRAHLDRMTMGEDSLKAEVLGLFRNQTQSWMRLLDPETDTADWRVAAHTLKGSAMGIGAWALAEACSVAEATAKKERILSQAEKRLFTDRIRVELDAALADIATIEHRLAIAALKAGKLPD
jgi:HPt (histidine-containing phosphotransfer) domain-containing protein